MRVALVHEYLVQYGGAEKTLEALREIFPKAPIYTLLYNPKKMNGKFSDAEIRTSFLQKIPFAKSRHRIIFPVLMPTAIEQFDLSYYDLVISDSSSFAKGIITKPHTKHICYCHTPTRFAWDGCQRYIKEEFSYPNFLKKIVPFGINYVRVWDEAASRRVDKFIANSKFTASRIKKYYNRDAEVIYPPIDVKEIQKNIANKPSLSNDAAKHQQEQYFLIISRLMANKNLELTVKVFNKNKLPLKIAGAGPLYKRLKKTAKPNIEILGFVSDEKKIDLLAGCAAFIFPMEEDLGITQIEAMAAGKPIIALRAGSALETIIKGKTGLFFNSAVPEPFEKAIKRFLLNKSKFDSNFIQQYALKFDKEVFKRKFAELIKLESL